MLHDPIGIALAEDIGSGDVTVSSFIEPNLHGRGRIISKEDAIVAGAEIAAEVFLSIDRELKVTVVRGSGSKVAPNETVLEMEGAVRSILTGERVAVNFLQRLSAVATLTRRFVDAVAGTKAKILDTRKTTPGLRAYEKEAVRAGGGDNHRFGLFDMVMLKDNHFAARGKSAPLRDDIARFREAHPGMRIEVEADTLDQVREFLDTGDIDIILLDNMTPDEMREAVRLRAGRSVLFEASGNVTLETVRGIAETGVDFISSGALTHSAPAVDFSLEIFPSDVSA
jgi:nicotinate-nucleotide pyrophosphorylase (carboxylating)